MAFKFEGKENYPIFVFAKCCWSIQSKVVRLGKRAHSREKPLLHKLCSFTSSLCTCPANRLVWSNIRNSLYAENAEKL